MKVTYTVWVHDKQHCTVEREVESWDMQGLLKAFDDACELRNLKTFKYRTEQKEKEASKERP